LKRRVWGKISGATGTSKLDLLSTFPLYAPYTGGKYRDKATLTIQALSRTLPLLSELSKAASGNLQSPEDIVRFAKTDNERAAARTLKEKFDFYGSDKANEHNYHHLYGTLLSDADRIENIFEIGLGTNNTEIAANMGARGKPGASLRAFRDHCPKANIYGADIDDRVLFAEERIETFYLDQTDPISFHNLLMRLPARFDLVIDDGLHSPHANIASLRFGLQIVKEGGWVVVEDISSEAICLWQVISALLPSSRYEPHIFKADGAIIFAVQRLR
jgi:hypothetical protein